MIQENKILNILPATSADRFIGEDAALLSPVNPINRHVISQDLLCSVIHLTLTAVESSYRFMQRVDCHLTIIDHITEGTELPVKQCNKPAEKIVRSFVPCRERL